MERNFAIKEYHNVSEIYEGVGKLAANPILLIKRDEMEKYMEGYNNKYASSKPVIDKAMKVIQGYRSTGIWMVGRMLIWF